MAVPIMLHTRFSASSFPITALGASNERERRRSRTLVGDTTPLDFDSEGPASWGGPAEVEEQAVAGRRRPQAAPPPGCAALRPQAAAAADDCRRRRPP